MLKKRMMMGAAVLAGGMAFAGSAEATLLNTNLVQNSDFDDTSGWNSLTGLETTVYSTGPHPSGLSASYFAGFANSTLSIDQVIELDGGDAGKPYDFEAWLGAWYADTDYSILTLQFFNGAGGTGSQVGSTVTFDGSSAAGVVENADGSGPGGWLLTNWSLYADSGLIPAGALSAVITQNAASLSGNGNDNYLDGVSFIITPEPASLALLGLGGLMMLRRRK